MDKNLLVDSWINKLAGIHEYQILCARTIDSTLTGITEWMELPPYQWAGVYQRHLRCYTWRTIIKLILN